MNGTTGAGVYGQCQGSDATIGPNGAFAPNSNNIASPPVLGTNQNNVATLGSLGITSLTDLVLIFNAIEPQNDTGGINLVDATIKFYSSTGTLLGSVDGNQNFTGTLSGNGNFGFAFQIDSAQRAALTAAFGSTSLSSIIIAMEGIVSNASGGADSFFVRSATGTVPDVPVPEPGSILLLSGGLALGACYAAIRKGRKAA
ncbi:MAG TPA: PEP-CTERM sorting domain-containing protein [Bryobacteraceae bacterium]|nr:PEP-CTERM sorting domain-containing protein [Bryobacteraceae bacterium]